MSNHNSFSENVRFIFQEYWSCFYCGKNTADCLHHIVGRGTADSKIESSILNAAPVCNQSCHLPNHGLLKTEEQIKKLLDKTYSFLVSINYKFTELDADFIERYANYYY